MLILSPLGVHLHQRGLHILISCIAHKPALLMLLWQPLCPVPDLERRATFTSLHAEFLGTPALTIVSKALNLNCSCQPQSRIRRSNKTKSSWFHELGGRSAQTFLAQVKYLTAALLTLGLPIAHWAGGGRFESPKTNGCYYLDAPKQFSQSLVS